MLERSACASANCSGTVGGLQLGLRMVIWEDPNEALVERSSSCIHNHRAFTPSSFPRLKGERGKKKSL